VVVAAAEVRAQDVIAPRHHLQQLAIPIKKHRCIEAEVSGRGRQR
jgi:hypothetical protein